MNDAPPPTNKYVTDLQAKNLDVNQKTYGTETLYNYINYQDTATNLLNVTSQFPCYLPTTTGIKEWVKDYGSTYSLMIEFPNVDAKHFAETGIVRAIEREKVTMRTFQISETKELTRRFPTEAEVNIEISIFEFFVNCEKTIKKQLNITDNPRRFRWNGAIQVRNKRDQGGEVLDDEYFNCSIRFQNNPKEIFKCVNNAYEEIDEETQSVKLISKVVPVTEIVKGCSVCPVHVFGRVFRQMKKDPVEAGWHLYLKRVAFLPPLVMRGVENVDVEEEENEEMSFLPMPNALEIVVQS